jgi:ABC transporter substrate binding protein
VSAYEVDVIVTVGSAVLAAKQATSDIPIVFALAADPVGSGLVASLAQPGGNVNGLWLQQTDAGGLYATYPNRPDALVLMAIVAKALAVALMRVNRAMQTRRKA